MAGPRDGSRPVAAVRVSACPAPPCRLEAQAPHAQEAGRGSRAGPDSVFRVGAPPPTPHRTPERPRSYLPAKTVRRGDGTPDRNIGRSTPKKQAAVHELQRTRTWTRRVTFAGRQNATGDHNGPPGVQVLNADGADQRARFHAPSRTKIGDPANTWWRHRRQAAPIIETLGQRGPTGKSGRHEALAARASDPECYSTPRQPHPPPAVKHGHAVPSSARRTASTC